MKHNHTLHPDFEGYSPNDMHTLLYDIFSENSPVKLLEMDQSDCRKVPIFNQIKYLLKLIDEKDELKLTAKGYLPPAVVTDIYNQGHLKESHIESGITKLYKEIDSITINLTRNLVELSGLVKKRANKLSLTKKAKSLIKKESDLLHLIFEVFTLKFNWSYYDGYETEQLGQMGFGFSLILLSRYGAQKRPDTFYAEKYFKAFPSFIMESEEPHYESKESHLGRCYSLRTFDRFLSYFGFVKIEFSENISGHSKIIKTDLFDKFIDCKLPFNPSHHRLH